MSAMSGLDFKDYVLRTFKRTDKDTELFEGVTDAVNQISKSHPFDETLTEKTTTDTITVLGDYRISLESDFEVFVSDVVLIDENKSEQLRRISKDEFDLLFPNPDDTNVVKAKPELYTIFDNQLYFGHVPDKITYTYKISYSQETGTITSGTPEVPFTDKYRVLVKYLTLFHLFEMVENDEQADKYRLLGAAELQSAILNDLRKKYYTSFIQYHGV